MIINIKHNFQSFFFQNFWLFIGFGSIRKPNLTSIRNFILDYQKLNQINLVLCPYVCPVLLPLSLLDCEPWGKGHSVF